jgi:hypothetical protein
MTALLEKFAAGEAEAQKIAVVCFAEDWRRYAPAGSAIADALLAPRRGRLPGELPHAHLDVAKDDLLRECPPIATNPRLATIVDEYRYAAILYRLYRCSMVHVGGAPHRTHGFTRDEEVFYMQLRRGFTSISFGPRLVTRWLRAVARGYAAACARAGVRPADDLDPGLRQEEALANKWGKI